MALDASPAPPPAPAGTLCLSFTSQTNFTSIRDGLSNTFMIGEALPSRTKWCSWAYANNACGTCAIAPNARPEGGGEYDPYKVVPKFLGELKAAIAATA